MINHRIDLECRIERLQRVAVETVHDLKHTPLNHPEYKVYECRLKNARYLINMYEDRLKRIGGK
jgi:hypothetical protein